MKPNHREIRKIAAFVALVGAAVAVAFIADITAAAYVILGLGATILATSLPRPEPELKPIPVRVERRRR